MGALEGKTAIVTGASSGMGAAIVRALRREGARVAGRARRAGGQHVNIDEIVVKALAQSSGARVVRKEKA